MVLFAFNYQGAICLSVCFLKLPSCSSFLFSLVLFAFMCSFSLFSFLYLLFFFVWLIKHVMPYLYLGYFPAVVCLSYIAPEYLAQLLSISFLWNVFVNCFQIQWAFFRTSLPRLPLFFRIWMVIYIFLRVYRIRVFFPPNVSTKFSFWTVSSLYFNSSNLLYFPFSNNSNVSSFGPYSDTSCIELTSVI